MSNYTPLTEEQKKELAEFAGLSCNGEQIAYFLSGEEVGRTDLVEMSSGTQRLRIAEMIGVKEFDDYHLINKDGSTRAKASDMKGLSVTDIDTDYGQSEGLKYKQFLKRHDKITDINQIDRHSQLGRLLISALAILTTECRTTKTPAMVIEELNNLADEIYK